MTRVAFLSQDSMDGFVCDDDVAIPAFAEAGLAVDTLSWRATGVDWSDYDAVIVRSTWDYQRFPDAFFATLEQIDQTTRLANPLALMRWNVDKRYLAELESKGVPTVPTLFGEALDEAVLQRLLTDAQGESVIKPVISAGAERTFRVPRNPDAGLKATLLEAHGSDRWMWQPFLNQVIEEGEYSLFYFSGSFSHAILKTPESGDFRVQEEFGAVIKAITPTAQLRATADAVVHLLAEVPLYARVDLVRGDTGWMLIELELIEPSLYLRMDAQASPRFAAAVKDWLAMR